MDINYMESGIELITSEVKEYLLNKKVAIYIPAYNGAKKIESLFNRIPEFFWDNTAEIYVVDNKSIDSTAEVVRSYAKQNNCENLNVYTMDRNRGYGGSQKWAYRHAIDNGYDTVIMLHCDEQYAPEDAPRLMHLLIVSDAGMVFGSRFLGDPLSGGMPLIRYLGVHFLNFVQNNVLQWNLSEYTSGYRIFQIDQLKEIPFEMCGDYFNFDTQILIQFKLRGITVRDDVIKTTYADEENYVNIYKNGFLILGTLGLYLLHKWGMKKSPMFSIISRTE